MGLLIAKAYRTNMFLGLADHTYVSCCPNDEKAWGCWGGKTGGRVLRTGEGSTRRANVIAESNERAGIICYGINGVCHQAANRILITAGITVEGAEGYRVSHALFGVYGVVGFPPCYAPFDPQPNIAGEDPQCVACSSTKAYSLEQESQKKDSDDSPEVPEGESAYLKKALALYMDGHQAFRTMWKSYVNDTQSLVIENQMKSFELLTEYRFSDKLPQSTSDRLSVIRLQTEKRRLELAGAFINGEMTVQDFVTQTNQEIGLFQQSAAELLSEAEYKQLFGMSPGKIVYLLDPEAAEIAFADIL
ncbi:MAG: hypothetical protein ACTFAL_05605 [Candidatus Electronema sp. V4]|uniref:hypothetical protein n=1 Tax=Candidatus Electronema sp. V4 TaxID=3454756 RepID=UPI0040556D19